MASPTQYGELCAPGFPSSASGGTSTPGTGAAAGSSSNSSSCHSPHTPASSAVRTSTGVLGWVGRVTPMRSKSRVSSATRTRASGAGGAVVVEAVEGAVVVVDDEVGASGPSSVTGGSGGAGCTVAPSDSGRRVSVAIARSVAKRGSGSTVPRAPMSRATTTMTPRARRRVRRAPP